MKMYPDGNIGSIIASSVIRSKTEPKLKRSEVNMLLDQCDNKSRCNPQESANVIELFNNEETINIQFNK